VIQARLSYVLRRAVRAMVQSPFGAVTVTLTIALALGALGACAGTGELVRRGLALWAKDLHFSVLLADLGEGCSQADRDRVAEQLWLAAPGVRPTFVSKSEALKAMRDSFGDLGPVLDELPSNPLRDLFEIPSERISGSRFDELARSLRGKPCVADVDFGGRWLGPARRFLAALQIGLVGLFALLVGVTLILVSNTFQLAIYARRDEIGILKLVGATDSFVRLPFLLEGLLEGLVGGGLAGLGLALGFAAGWPRVLAAVPPLASLGLQPFPLAQVALGTLGLGGLLGFIASGLSVERFLRV
jgi:cell division transport system permease protein